MNHIINTAYSIYDSFLTFLADNPEWMVFMVIGLPLSLVTTGVVIGDRRRAKATGTKPKFTNPPRPAPRHRRSKEETAEEFFAMIDRFYNEIPDESSVAA